MKSYNFNKFNEPTIAKSSIILILVLYICWLFTTYMGNHHSVYLHMWKYVFGIFSFVAGIGCFLLPYDTIG